jgi:hypothetical protein
MFMSEHDITARDEEMLGTLAELDLALAKALYSRAMAAGDAAEMAALGRAYQRLGRSLRQTIALRDRLRRQRRQDARNDPSPPLALSETPPPADEVRIARRKTELCAAVRRVIWNETEVERQDYLCELLDRRLDDARLPDDFGASPLDDHIAQLCADLGLPRPAVACGRRLPPGLREPAEPASAETERRSSA